MQKFAVILLSFLSTIAVLAQNDGLQEIDAQVTETVTQPQYDFAPDEGSPDVEVAPLAVNAKDQDVPLKPTISESVEVEENSANSDNDDN